MNNMLRDKEERLIALAGNPNVGKSTLFNALTGLRQHTGNWAGKTVENACGTFCVNGRVYRLMDVPGCYSLLARSAEERVAGDFICFQDPDAVILVCDATCLERGLILALQVMETGRPVLLAVNLLDEARKRKIHVDLEALSAGLKIPVVGLAARSGQGLAGLTEALQRLTDMSGITAPADTGAASFPAGIRPLLHYPEYLEEALSFLVPAVRAALPDALPSARWIALRLLEGDDDLNTSLEQYLGFTLHRDFRIRKALERCHALFSERGIPAEKIHDDLAAVYVSTAERLCRRAVRSGAHADARDRRLDGIFTGKLTGFPIMLLFFLFLFWLTIRGANYPSALLSHLFSTLEAALEKWFLAAGVPERLTDLLLGGVFRTVAWVVAVMLPPMAIFFPLFTLLEDFGYLPRIAFNLDRCFQGCSACGKQALTMAMGFGCNAVGVTGCRIIDSDRERLIAVLTNAFVPCNGRLPILLSLITLFLAGGGPDGALLGACILTALLLLGILMTLAASALLSATILKGTPSSFVLELPPYRRPQVMKVLLRSIPDRIVRVLGRAVRTAAPAGLLIWLLANLHTAGGSSFLAVLTGLLDPFARQLGLDGVILTGFLLGLPANEIVIPIIVMACSSNESLTVLEGLPLRELLMANGWTRATAVSTLIFTLFHWPCATTLLTIRKETGSLKWTLTAFLLPTAFGFLLCFLFHRFLVPVLAGICF